LMIGLVMVLLLIIVGFLGVEGSKGDRDYRYQQCKANCISSTCSNPDYSLPWYLKLLAWDCPDDCAYQCQRENYLLRKTNGEPIEQYHGKWPFLRVFGIQELFSSLFSFGNFLPHFWSFFRIRREVPDRNPQKILWLIYAFFGMNAWVWSTAFHARDIRITEILDYFSAITFVVMGTAIGICRTLEIHKTSNRIPIFGVAILFLLQHYYYMLYVKFDYGWNTLASIISGGIGTVFWLYWLWKHRRPHGWKVIFCQVSLWVASSLEIFDFPPLWDLLDAHAIWHGSTIHTAFIWYWFVMEDIEYEEANRNKLL